MAKQQTELEKEIDLLTDKWVAVNKKENPTEWQAWYEWRRAQMGSYIEPDNFTVPSMWPPMTLLTARNYFDVVRKIRKSIGWNKSSAQLADNPRPYSPE